MTREVLIGTKAERNTFAEDSYHKQPDADTLSLVRHSNNSGSSRGKEMRCVR